MDTELIVGDFMKREIGGIIVADESENILYSDERSGLSDHALKRFLQRAPRLSGRERKTWELTDSDLDKYFRILSVAEEFEGKLYICHFVNDVSELANLSKNISEYSKKISDFSDFQSKILKVISKPYDSFLPALAELCRSSEAVIRMEHKSENKMIATIYDGETRREVHSLGDGDTFAFSMKRFDRVDGYRCFICESTADRRYAVLLKDTEGFSEEYFKDISVYNVIRLYVENGMLREKIIYESLHDKLTGLYNASTYSQMAEDDFGRPGTIAVYIAGVSDLEYMNDHYGNEAGDAIIKKAAESLRPELGDNILGFRIGGDKFVIVAKDIPEEDARKLVQVWKDRLALLNSTDGRFRCTISCGMAYGTGDYDTDRLLEQADVGMYREKRRLKEELIRKAAVR
ncbi:MAG: diguanylate cyclase [Ruminiclostridium sp.]|nr:diguanylate cyclase [Ruminiclostridium sp.]